MTAVSVRPATAADVPAIRHIGEVTWPATYAFAGPDYIAHGVSTWWSEESVARSLETTRTLVAEHDGEIVGMGNVDLRGEPPVIWKLYVLPERQGLGAGGALLEALVAEAPDGVLLEYTAGNDRAARFYARHGFVELRRDPPEQPGWPEQVWMIRRPDAGTLLP